MVQQKYSEKKEGNYTVDREMPTTNLEKIYIPLLVIFE